MRREIFTNHKIISGAMLTFSKRPKPSYNQFQQHIHDELKYRHDKSMVEAELHHEEINRELKQQNHNWWG